MIRVSHVRTGALVLALSLAGLSASGALARAAEAPPVAGGKIGTLLLGKYVCELQGDAMSAPGKPLPDYTFTVVNGSGYNARGIRGTYLLTDSLVTFTTGAFKGLKLNRTSRTKLAQISGDGAPQGMRCILDWGNG